MREQDEKRNLKIFLAEGDAEVLQQSMTQFSALGNEVVGTVNSGESAVDRILEAAPDVVLCEMFLPQIDALGVLEELRGAGFDGIFMVTSCAENAAMAEKLSLAGADYFLVRPFSFRYMQRRMEKLCDEKRPSLASGKVATTCRVRDQFELEACVTKLIQDIGMPASVRGYNFVRKAILLALENGDILNSITKELYPTVAKCYKTTASRVERAIRHAIETAWQRGDIEVIHSLFGYTIKNTKGKPTNGEFISLLADRIRLDLKIG